MSSKRKWDQAAPDATESDSNPAKVTKVEEGKTASEAAAAAAAIAAKIAASFANGAGKDPYDGDFTHDIDINDLRNRYLLTRGTTQTTASISSFGATPESYCSQDTRGNRCFSQHEGNLVSRSFKSNRERPSPLSSYRCDHPRNAAKGYWKS
jgi:hypothetical protein